MYNHEKQHLQSGFDALAPDLLENICNQEVKFIESEEDLFGKKEEQKHRHRRKVYITGLGSMAAFAIICLIILFYSNQTLSNKKQIIFDINPSICITLDKNNQVQDIDALNEDGKQIISDIQKGVSLEQSVNQILQRLDEYDYLRNDDSEMLITYVCKDGEEPQLSVESAINEYMELANCSLTIIYQRLEPQKKLTNSAKKQGISVGKYYFLQRLENEYGMDTHNLYQENIHEIVNCIKKQGIDISNIASAPSATSTQNTSETEKKKATEKVTEKTTKKVTEKVTEQSTEQPIETVTEKITEKVTEQATEQSLESISPSTSETTNIRIENELAEETTIPFTDTPIVETSVIQNTTVYTETSVTENTVPIDTTDETESTTNKATQTSVETTTTEKLSESETSDSTTKMKKVKCREKRNQTYKYRKIYEKTTDES